MKKIVLITILSISISFLLISWGSTGHYNINYKSTLSFPVSMSAFLSWADSLANHGSDADYRKSWDPNESIRHYIDIDNYPEFNSTGHIPATFDSVVNIHGLSFVENEGTLPWATVKMYDSLVMAFQQHDWNAAMLHASDLGHYVADAHMPLHITKNYDGQYTGQSGIHSRYESDLVYYFENEIAAYSGDTVHIIPNVNHYVFDYIYNNYQYIDSVLAADSYAENLIGNHTSFSYYQAFWNKAKYFSVLMFHNASHSLAELIYTAWVEAGSPQMNAGINNTNTSGNMDIQVTVYPNPASSKIYCSFILSTSTKIKFSIIDSSGKVFKSLNKGFPKGQNKVDLDITGIPKGIYFINFQTKKAAKYSRIIII